MLNLKALESSESHLRDYGYVKGDCPKVPMVKSTLNGLVKQGDYSVKEDCTAWMYF